MKVLKKCTKRKRTDKTINDFSLELFTLNLSDLRSDQAMNIFFSDCLKKYF